MKYAFIIAFSGLIGFATGAVLCRHVVLERELGQMRRDLNLHAHAISDLQSKLLPKTDFRPKPDMLVSASPSVFRSVFHPWLKNP